MRAQLDWWRDRPTEAARVEAVEGRVEEELVRVRARDRARVRARVRVRVRVRFRVRVRVWVRTLTLALALTLACSLWMLSTKCDEHLRGKRMSAGAPGNTQLGT